MLREMASGGLGALGRYLSVTPGFSESFSESLPGALPYLVRSRPTPRKTPNNDFNLFVPRTAVPCATYLTSPHHSPVRPRPTRVRASNFPPTHRDGKQGGQYVAITAFQRHSMQ